MLESLEEFLRKRKEGKQKVMGSEITFGHAENPRDIWLCLTSVDPGNGSFSRKNDDNDDLPVEFGVPYGLGKQLHLETFSPNEAPDKPTTRPRPRLQLCLTQIQWFINGSIVISRLENIQNIQIEPFQTRPY